MSSVYFAQRGHDCHFQLRPENTKLQTKPESAYKDPRIPWYTNLLIGSSRLRKSTGNVIVLAETRFNDVHQL